MIMNSIGAAQIHAKAGMNQTPRVNSRIKFKSQSIGGFASLPRFVPPDVTYWIALICKGIKIIRSDNQSHLLGRAFQELAQTEHWIILILFPKSADFLHLSSRPTTSIAQITLRQVQISKARFGTDRHDNSV